MDPLLNKSMNPCMLRLLLIHINIKIESSNCFGFHVAILHVSVVFMLSTQVVFRRSGFHIIMLALQILCGRVNTPVIRYDNAEEFAKFHECDSESPIIMQRT